MLERRRERNGARASAEAPRLRDSDAEFGSYTVM